MANDNYRDASDSGTAKEPCQGAPLILYTTPRLLQPRGHASCGPGFWFQTKITDGNEGDASDSGVAVEPCRGV